VPGVIAGKAVYSQKSDRIGTIVVAVILDANPFRKILENKRQSKIVVIVMLDPGFSLTPSAIGDIPFVRDKRCGKFPLQSSADTRRIEHALIRSALRVSGLTGC
jgi:hypothetical protein